MKFNYQQKPQVGQRFFQDCFQHSLWPLPQVRLLWYPQILYSKLKIKKKIN